MVGENSQVDQLAIFASFVRLLRLSHARAALRPPWHHIHQVVSPHRSTSGCFHCGA